MPVLEQTLMLDTIIMSHFYKMLQRFSNKWLFLHEAKPVPATVLLNLTHCLTRHTYGGLLQPAGVG